MDSSLTAADSSLNPSHTSENSPLIEYLNSFENILYLVSNQDAA